MCVYVGKVHSKVQIENTFHVLPHSIDRSYNYNLPRDKQTITSMLTYISIVYRYVHDIRIIFLSINISGSYRSLSVIHVYGYIVNVNKHV